MWAPPKESRHSYCSHNFRFAMKVMPYISIAAMIFVTSCVTSGGSAEPAREYITEGMQVPEFTLSGSEGRTFRSSDDFAGKTTLLVFFASWCPQCQAELPAIDATWQAVQDDPQYDVIAVSRGGASGKYEQSAAILEEYWSTHGLSMPWFLDADRRVFDKFASADIPRAYIVVASGTVVWRAVTPKLDAVRYLELLKKY